MRDIYTVQRLNNYLKNMFAQDILLRSVLVKGEVSNVTYQRTSGHIYYTIKDESGVLNCMMFANKRPTGLKFTLVEGQNVVCAGTVSHYAQRGEYRLIATQIILDGQGELNERYEKLKQELEEQGLFADIYKKPIPKYAKRIGVVTSPTGAVIQDIRNVAGRRNPYVQIYLYPAIVQGESAASSIVNGIRALDRFGVDVIIIGRGGGSIEDLWAFNEEIVARAIFECNTPIVSAVGHETDYTIADYVSDMRAPTPSAAAEITVFDITEFESRIISLKSQLHKEIVNKLSVKKQQLAKAKLMVDKLNPSYEIDRKKMHLSYCEERLFELLNKKIDVLKMRHMAYKDRMPAIMEKILNSKKQTYALLIEQMKVISPLEKLSRGYAYAEGDDGKALKSVTNVKKDDSVTLYLKDGKLMTKVLDVEFSEGK